MKTFKSYLTEIAKKRGWNVLPKHKDDLSTDKYGKHKSGDTVWALQADNATWKPGKVKRVGRTMYHVTHHDGSESAYAPEHVTNSDMSDQNPNK